MITCADIETLIKKALPEADVRVTNPSGDGQHFIGEVASPRFKGLRLIEQHRLVLAALGEAFATRLHGLKLTTRVK
jgi:stress-induced morphogen